MSGSQTAGIGYVYVDTPHLHLAAGASGDLLALDPVAAPLHAARTRAMRLEPSVFFLSRAAARATTGIWRGPRSGAGRLASWPPRGLEYSHQKGFLLTQHPIGATVSATAVRRSTIGN